MAEPEHANTLVSRGAHLSRNLRWFEVWALSQNCAIARPDLVELLVDLGQYAQHTHAALLSFAEPIPPLTALLHGARGEPLEPCTGSGICSDAVRGQFDVERERLQRLANQCSHSPWGQAVMHATRAYYGLVLLDGFRATFWLERALDDVGVLDTLPPGLRRLRLQLRATVQQVVAPARAAQPSRPPELYSSLQVVVDHLGSTAQPTRAGLKLIDDFGVHLDVHAAHICEAAGERSHG